MAKERVFITVRGGIIQSVDATKNMDIVVVDYDDYDEKEEGYRHVYIQEPDTVTQNVEEVFSDTKTSEWVKSALARLQDKEEKKPIAEVFRGHYGSSKAPVVYINAKDRPRTEYVHMYDEGISVLMHTLETWQKDGYELKFGRDEQ